MTLSRGEFTLSWDPAAQQAERIHAYLTQSYWAEGISLALVKKSLEHSLCFGVFTGGEQIGLSRVITDRATYMYLCDVYVLEVYRGQGLAGWMMEAILAHPDMQGLRRFSLATRDAHKLYARYGFTPLSKPESMMEMLRPGLYKNKTVPQP
jgi:GNAT superfamily N-acetyltransferase